MNKIKYLLFAIVLFASTFTHLYRINHTFTFHNDEARDVLIVKKMIDTGKPVLLGPQTSVGNMYLGPLYYYMMLPALVMSGMNPIGPAIMVAIFGVITSILLFYIGTRRYSLMAGTVAGLFYSLTPVMIHYSRSSWNPNTIPFFATLLIFAWYEKSYLWWLMLGMVAGAIFQLHYVALVMVALVGLSKLKERPNWKLVLLAVIGFLIISAPFWLFEIRHNFVNSLAFITFLKDGSRTSDINSTYFSRLTSNVLLVVKGVIGSSSISLTPVPTLFLSIAGILIFLVLPFIASAGYLSYVIIGSVFLTSFLKEPMNVHYISYLFPVVALALGAISATGPRLIRVVTLVTISLILWHGIPTLIYNLDKIDSVQVERSSTIAAYIVDEAHGRSYNVVSTPGTYATSVEYYLALSKNPPITSLTDLIFDICENAPCPESDTTTVLFYASGPTHPAIAEYLGHPSINEYSVPRTMQKNELVSYSIWVATMTIDH